MFAVVRVLMPFETHYIIFRCQIVCALARTSGLAHCATLLRIMRWLSISSISQSTTVLPEATR